MQDQNNGDKDKKQVGENDKKQITTKTKSEIRVEGLGKPLKILKNPKKKPDSDEEKTLTIDRKSSDEMHEKQNTKLPIKEPKVESKETENSCKLKDLLTEPVYTRLLESNTGLHLKVCTSHMNICRLCLISGVCSDFSTAISGVDCQLQIHVLLLQN